MEVFHGLRKDGGQSRSVGGQRVKGQGQEPRKSQVHMEGIGKKSQMQRQKEPEQNRKQKPWKKGTQTRMAKVEAGVKQADRIEDTPHVGL